MSWETKPFEEVFKVRSPKMKIPRKHYLDKGNHPIVSQEDDHVSGFTNKNDSLNRFEGPVIIFGDHTRVVKYIDFPFAQGADGVKILEPVSNVIPKFMFHQLEFRKPKSLGYARHFRLLKKVCFVNPPITEQERIVEVLDAAFEAIDKAKANIERNLANARELFQSRLNDIFSNPSSDWEVKPLGEVCSIVADLIDPRKDEYLNRLHVGGGNIVSESGQLIGLRTSAEEGLKSGKFPFTNADVLYNKIRPYLVKVARPDFEGICSADMYPLRPSEEISRDFLFYALISERFTSYAVSVSARAGMPKVNRKDLFEYNISFPLNNEQEHIVTELDGLIELKKAIEAQYQSEVDSLEELRQSILEQAFEGKLTEPIEV